MEKSNLDIYVEEFSLFELIMAFHINMKEYKCFNLPNLREIALHYLYVIHYRLQDLSGKEKSKEELFKALKVESVGQEVLQEFLNFYLTDQSSPYHSAPKLDD